jgi:hypothetical protein
MDNPGLLGSAQATATVTFALNTQRLQSMVRSEGWFAACKAPVDGLVMMAAG